MKRSAFILVILAGFFMLQPAFYVPQPTGCSDDVCPMQKSCAAKQDCEKKKSKDNCNSNGCNPFMTCWCGNFFVAEKPFTSQTPVASVNQEFATRDEKNVTGIAFECWHPPEMV